MGNRFLMARYRASEALLYQIFMQRQGLPSSNKSQKKIYHVKCRIDFTVSHLTGA